MPIIGCDYHPSFQQIAYVDTEGGELREERLAHREGAEKFYRALAVAGQRVRVGMEASGHARCPRHAYISQKPVSGQFRCSRPFGNKLAVWASEPERMLHRDPKDLLNGGSLAQAF